MSRRANTCRGDRMSKRLRIVANGQEFSASPGEILLDAALHQGLNLPHECRAGQCGSCLVRVLRGHTIGGETKQRRVVHACRARLFTDSEISFDILPPIARLSGYLASLERLSWDVVGLCIRLDHPLQYLPGQYCRVKFRGFPARCFSPTSPFVGVDRGFVLRFHVKLVRDGAVTSELGAGIKPGHRVTIEGPFGSAYYRPNEGHRLVLAASGTGFAPIWAIAAAALRRQPHRPMHLIAGVKRLQSLYMVPALHRLASHPNATCVVATQEAQERSEIIRQGSPVQFLPQLVPTDIVYAAGAPAMVDAIGDAAESAGAAFYADPFTASTGRDTSWFDIFERLMPRMVGAA